MLAWLLLLIGLKLDGWLLPWLQRSVEVGYSSRKTIARVLVASILNLSYWIVIYFATWQNLLKAILPVAAFLETAIPNSFQEFLKTPWWVFCTVFFICPLGPMTIYTITWFRFEKGEDKGRTTLRYLELLFYLSLILLSLNAVLSFNPDRFRFFAHMYLVIILPITLGTIAFIMWGEPQALPKRRIWTMLKKPVDDGRTQTPHFLHSNEDTVPATTANLAP